MKYIENIKLFEAVRKPRMGDFFYDIYVHPICDKSRVNSIVDYTEGKKSWFGYLGKKYFVIEMVLRNVSWYDEDDIKKILEVSKSLKPFCVDSGRSKKSDAVGVIFNFERIIFRMILTNDKIEEIKSTEEYKKWLVGAEMKWNKHKEELNLKKITKKYNI